MAGHLTKYSLWCPEHAETLATDYRTDEDGLPTCCPLNAEHTNITGIAVVHEVNYLAMLLEAPFTPVEEGMSVVITNGRPALEAQPAITAFAGSRMTWPSVGDPYTKIFIGVKFILKEAGTGTKIRIAMKAKSNAVGSDTSEPFDPVGVIVVPVTHTTIGEVFEGEVEFQRTSFEEEDAVALQVGRDGNNEIGSGDDDDVSVPIQIIAFKLGAK